MDRNKSGRLKVLVWIMAVLTIAEIVLGIWGGKGQERDGAGGGKKG